MGRTLEQNALVTCSKKQGRPAARGTVQTSAVFGLFRGDAGEKTRKKYQAQVDAINRLEPEMQNLSDEQLADKTKDLKSRAQRNGTVDDLLVEAFAVSYNSLAFSLVLSDSSLARSPDWCHTLWSVCSRELLSADYDQSARNRSSHPMRTQVVREASNRVLGLRPFDVQLIGGMILHNGEIAEMRTGEGKTLVAVLPAYLNALAGKGVQVSLSSASYNTHMISNLGCFVFACEHLSKSRRNASARIHGTYQCMALNCIKAVPITLQRACCIAHTWHAAKLQCTEALFTLREPCKELTLWEPCKELVHLLLPGRDSE